MGTKIPFGFKIVDGKLIEEPNEQAVIRQIMSLHDKGYSFNAIAKELKKVLVTNCD